MLFQKFRQYYTKKYMVVLFEGDASYVFFLAEWLTLSLLVRPTGTAGVRLAALSFAITFFLRARAPSPPLQLGAPGPWLAAHRRREKSGPGSTGTAGGAGQ